MTNIARERSSPTPAGQQDSPKESFGPLEKTRNILGLILGSADPTLELNQAHASVRRPCLIRKRFAQAMVDDHTKTNEELTALAQKKDMTLPAALNHKHQKKFKEMSEKTGSDFDKAYCHLMAKDHKGVVNMLKNCLRDSHSVTVI